ncbi:MAG: DUF420 domain-containing protein [Cryomorphaceae bacterium]|nr:MAG: DUF420 domain-containing protein [Cryomorphaceae bacterium]
MSQSTAQQPMPYKALIITLSMAVPLAVAALFFVKIEGYDLSFLPGIYATINGLTAVLLVLALLAIKQGKIDLHKKLMMTALVFSAAFLVLYVLYHITSESTPYGGEGWVRSLYFFVLLTHILLSVAIIPLVLFTFVRGWVGHYEQHKKLARITWPMWFYVAVTGVVVYLMISPYYT